MSRELDKQIGAMLGYTVYHYDKDYAENCYYTLLDAAYDPVVLWPFRAGERKTEDEAWEDLPFFSTDIAAAALVEDEIERRGLGTQYLLALDTALNLSGYYSDTSGNEALIYTFDEAWLLLRATPAQRCRAALQVAEKDRN